MTEEFKKAMDIKAVDSAHKKWVVAQRAVYKDGFKDGSKSAYEWCSKLLVTDLHYKRLKELGECFAKRKKLKEAFSYAVKELEAYANDENYHNIVAVDTAKSLGEL